MESLNTVHITLPKMFVSDYLSREPYASDARHHDPDVAATAQRTVNAWAGITVRYTKRLATLYGVRVDVETVLKDLLDDARYYVEMRDVMLSYRPLTRSAEATVAAIVRGVK